MGELIRRRGMVDKAEEETWDCVWDYTMGLPGNNGWTKTISGGAANVTEALTSTHLEISAKQGCYIRYDAPSAGSVSKGVMEAVFNTAQPVSGAQQLAGLCIGDGTYALFVAVTPDSRLRFWDKNLPSNSTVVYNDIQNRVYYTIRLVLNENVGEIYVDGTKVATVDTTKTYYKRASRFTAQSTSSAKAYWKSVKVRSESI